MLNRVQIILRTMLTVAVFSVTQSFASVLWWTTNDPADIEVESWDGESYTTAEALGVTDARVKVVGDGVADDTYLCLAYVVEDDFGNQTVAYGTPPGGTVQYIATGDGAGEIFADLGEYAKSGYSFLVELGQWDDSGQTWTALALSQSATFDQLSMMGGLNPGENYISEDPLETPGSLPWKPDNYTRAVPEPGSALLIIIGCSLIALKRKVA